MCLALVTKLMTTVTVISRAVENNAFLCYANRVGSEFSKEHNSTLTFCGNSVIGLLSFLFRCFITDGLISGILVGR
jgi:hypothetical protein